MIDLKCPICERIQLDHLERDEDKIRPECCGSPMDRVFLPTERGNVIGDEIDVTIKNGLCGPDGEPTRFRSREALRKATEKAGLTNYVRHLGTKGGDRSKATTRWT